MKKIVFLSFVALCLAAVVQAQVVDDIYYVPSPKKEKKTETDDSQRKRRDVTPDGTVLTVRSTSPLTTVVVEDHRGNVRDIDEYNRRYDSRHNDFVLKNDTLLIREKDPSEPDGEWVHGFDGTADDYEYATRLIRFRNPRYTVSISSPYYWDIVYGLDSWRWNVYVDDFYAYVFPTFSNSLWWDWRYGWGPYGWGWPAYYGWGGWYDPYWSFAWGGWYGGWTWGHYHHYPYYHGWYGGGWGERPDGRYTHRRSIAGTRYATGTDLQRGTSGTVRGTSSLRRGGSSARQRLSGTRGSLGRRVVSTRGSSVRSRTSGSSVRRSVSSRYTRPTVEGRSTYRMPESRGRVGVGSSYRTSSSYRRDASSIYSPSGSRMGTRSGLNSRRSTPSYTPNTRSGSSRSSFSGGGGGGSRSSGVRSGGGGGRSGGSSRRR